MIHSHGPAKSGRVFALAIALNLIFVLVEFFYGLSAGSLALIADAGHNLGDVASLALAWAGMAASGLKSDSRHSYGWRRGSILASFINAALLLVMMGALSWEALGRLQTSVVVEGATVMAVAGIGVVINGITVVLFMRGSKRDLNVRGAFLHMAADTMVSIGVVIGGAMTLVTGWIWIDPIMGVAISVIVIVGTWSLFRQSLHLLFDGVPEDFDLASLNNRLLELPGVTAVHDLYVWALSTTEIALTAHLVVADGEPDGPGLLTEARNMICTEFGLYHVTLQIEPKGFAQQCNLIDCIDRPLVSEGNPEADSPALEEQHDV
jgi:cobalt-zinc-cadmium efflux system protein